MSLASYKKILSVAETILSKIDLPRETFDKYNEFKDRLLEDGGLDAGDIVVELQSELVGMYHQFVKAATDILGLISDAGGDMQAAIEHRLGQFIDTFNRKQKLVRETIEASQGKTSIEGKVVLQRLVDNVEEMEIDFDKMVNLLGSTGDIIRERESENYEMQGMIEKLQTELEESKESLKDSSLLGKEYKALQLERDLLANQVQERDQMISQLKDDQETTHAEMSLKIESLSQSQRHNQRSTHELERAFERLVGFFRPHISSEKSEVMRSRNLPSILDHIEDFVADMTEDNKKLLDEMKAKDSNLEELQSQSETVDKKMSTYMADIRQLVSASNECMLDIDNHANTLHKMRMSFTH